MRDRAMCVYPCIAASPPLLSRQLVHSCPSAFSPRPSQRVGHGWKGFGDDDVHVVYYRRASSHTSDVRGVRPSVCSVLLQACRVFLGILWSVIVIIPWSVFVVAASACAAVAGTFLATCKANYRRTLGGVAQAESEKTGFGCLAGVVQAAALSWVALLPLRFSVRVCSVRRRLNIFCTLLLRLAP